MISQKVKQFANDNGFDFFVSGLGYRGTAQITNLDGTVNITRCSNNSKLALQAINTLIAQRELDAKSDEAIATEAEQVYEDLTPVTPAICEVEAEQAYLELQPVAPAPNRRRFERPSYMGIGIEVYSGNERYGYALAELLERRPANPVDVDYTLYSGNERYGYALAEQLDRPVDHPAPTYTPRDNFGDDAFVFSARYGCGALI